jgi:CheY-like chemotaxis protein
VSEATILVVEDESSFVEALTIGLSREGFDVVVALDGAEALEKFEKRYDLIWCCSTSCCRGSAVSMSAANSVRKLRHR